MHYDQTAGAVAMWVRVFFRRAAVRGPTRVAHAVSAVERFLPQRFFEVAQFAFGPADLQLVVFVNDGNARGVVAAVFKLAQAVDNQRHHLFVSDVSDYSTHVSEQLAVSSEQSAVGGKTFSASVNALNSL